MTKDTKSLTLSRLATLRRLTTLPGSIIWMAIGSRRIDSEEDETNVRDRFRFFSAERHEWNLGYVNTMVRDGVARLTLARSVSSRAIKGQLARLFATRAPRASRRVG